MKTPDFTLPALSALAVSLASACVVLFKLDLTDAQKGALTVIVGAVCTIGWFMHDAIVRHGRAGVAAAAVAADAAAPVTPEPEPIPAPVAPPPPVAVPRARRRT